MYIMYMSGMAPQSVDFFLPLNSFAILSKQEK